MKKGLIRCTQSNGLCHIHCIHQVWHTMKEHNATPKHCSGEYCLTYRQLKDIKVKDSIERKGW